MDDRPFVAHFPKPIEVEDRVIIKGRIRNDAQIFSVNFTWDTGPVPAYIAYHFKTLFNVSKEVGVVQNYKYNQWGEEKVHELTWIECPGDFILEFVFKEYEILVYSENGYHYSFDHQLDMDRIKTIQIWDDLEYLESITFLYGNKK